MLFEFFLWWYGPGWLAAWKKPTQWSAMVSHAFSISVLLNTLFSPWHRIVTMPGRSLGEKFRAVVDNAISRVVGFFVRLGALLAALVLMLGAVVSGLLTALAWPLLPALVAYLLFRSIAG